jgi:hypothetical protein
MSKMVKMLKSDDYESKQRQLTKLKKDIAQMTEEMELIEMSLNTETQ